MKAFSPQQSIQRWTQRLGQLSSAARPAVEDSVWLRIFVQSLVSVGILSTDIAATTQSGLWAIPLSIVGATWSWYCRRRRNIVAKFGIAIGMLGVLGVFLSQLLSNAGDSRLLLAGLLIQLQVLHTFDMPRRKDLGYSAVIGLILIGVAATISETMAFGGFLVVFVAIALPVLLLDYRSRIGLGNIRIQSLTLLPPRKLAVLLGAILGLGLLIFALTPRLPGYQFRTFPVSGEVAIQGKFDAAKVFNPGYLNGVKGSKAGGKGSQTMGSGSTQSFSSKFYYGFNEEMNQNLRGSLTPQVVMRVRSQVEGFWRVMAFDQYTGQGWKVSRNSGSSTLRRAPWSYRFVVPQLSPQSRTKEIVQTFSILTEFPNLLPALSQAREIYFPTQEIALDPEGGLRSPGPLEEGLTYSVVSDVPYRDRTRLNHISKQYPKAIREIYLQVPAAVKPQIRQKTEALLAKAQRPLPTPYEQALYLTQSLKQQYSLKADIAPLKPGQDLVETFLSDWGGGYPDHFASVLTVMLRSIGIPARLSTGFGPGEFNPFTGMHVVKNTDAYALTEVYFPGNGWFAFDPIPGHSLYPPSIEVDQSFSVLRHLWNWVAGWLPSPVAGWLSGAIAVLGKLFAKVLGLGSQGWAGVIKLALLAGGGGVGLWALWQGWQAWRTFYWLQTLPPMARLYHQMLNFLSEQGIQKHPTETPLEYARQVSTVYPSHKAQIVNELSYAYIAWKYGNISPDLGHLRQHFQHLRRQG
jgi:protein-glutamine gamma-glutamyltransferase